MTVTSTTPARQSILDGLDALYDSDVDLPKKLTNEERLVADAFIWQEVSAEAERRAKAAWKLIEDGGLIAKKDKLRDLGPGEHSAFAGQYFAVTAEVSAPGSRFDKDGFINTVSKRFKIPLGKLTPIAETSVKENKAACSVKAVEL